MNLELCNIVCAFTITNGYFLGILIAIGILCYLVYTLINPHKF